MNASQLNSFVRSLLKVIGTILTMHGLAHDASWLNSEDVAGLAVTLAGFIWSHLHHGQDTDGPVNIGKVGVVALLCGTLALQPGCALLNQNSTATQKAADVQNLCYAAASIGTQAALIQNPSYRPAFSLAYTNLNALVTGKIVTGTLLRQILAGLPVNELKSPQATLAISSATMLYDSLAGTAVNVETNIYVLAAATGIRDGMKVGLGY